MPRRAIRHPRRAIPVFSIRDGDGWDASPLNTRDFSGSRPGFLEFPGGSGGSGDEIASVFCSPDNPPRMARRRCIVKGCGRAIPDGSRIDRRYCSGTCKDREKRRRATGGDPPKSPGHCINCRSPFPIGARAGRRYCSDRCRQSWTRLIATTIRETLDELDRDELQLWHRAIPDGNRLQDREDQLVIALRLADGDHDEIKASLDGATGDDEISIAAPDAPMIDAGHSSGRIPGIAGSSYRPSGEHREGMPRATRSRRHQGSSGDEFRT